MLEELQVQLEGDQSQKFEDYKVCLVQDFDSKLLNDMVDFGLNIFGDLGMDEWGLVPQIRHGNVYVMQDIEDEIIGLAILMRDWEDADMCYLFDFAITPELQGKGLGTYFLNAIISNMEENGFSKMSLTVDINNKPAIKLYKDKIGFKIDHFSKDEYGKGHDRYIMKLNFHQTMAN